MKRAFVYSLLVFYGGFIGLSFNADNTSSYFTDVEVSEGNTITTGVWVVPPIEKDDCKKYGWEELIDPETGEIFKNQGQCVSEANHIETIEPEPSLLTNEV